MRHLDLFSGIGGFALAAQWAGIETVGFCEIEDFPRKVLAKNFPGIKIHEDIKYLNGEEYEGIDLITGGYPCQPFSVAGRQRAAEDARHLWPEMFRVITQAKPTWVLCENVYGHVTLGLDQVLHDLESGDYTAQSFVIPALAAGANHRRDRVFIVAHTSSNGCYEGETARCHEKTNGRIKKKQNENIYDERRCCIRASMERRSSTSRGWGIEPPTLRVDDGLPNRVDRLKSLGNAIVPQVAYEIMKAIKLAS